MVLLHSIKTNIKRVFGVDPQSGVSNGLGLKLVGSKLHGYYVPENFLTKDSVCYLVGAGEDISFDTELKIIFDSHVIIIDPAPEGINHFRKLVDMTSKGEKLTIGRRDPFTYRINSEQLAQIKYVEKGVWDQETVLKFYTPDRSDYASHSIQLFKETGKFIEAPVDRLKNLMKKLNHDCVDLLKLEIEGAEYTVIDTIVEDKLNIKAILVEFDEVYHSKDFRYLFRIKKSTDKLIKAGYVLVHSSDHFKRLFVRKDIYSELKKKH